LFADLAPTVDIFSLDEAFIDISDCTNLYPEAAVFGRQIQAQIQQQLGEWVTCNVGISYTRLLAKLASEVSPKGSVTTIDQQNRDSYLSQASFKDICGIGYRLEKKLARLGITNPYQINFFSPEDLEPLVGPFWVKELFKIAQGQDSKTLAGIDQRRHQPMKSVGRTITGFKLCDDEEEIKQVLYNLSEEAAHKIRQMGMAARQVGVMLTGAGSWYQHQTLPRYVHRTQDIFKLIYQLYQPWQRNFAVIRFGVFLSDLRPIDQVQPSLFEREHQRNQLTQAVDQLNSRYGLFTVRPATLTKSKLIRPEVTGYLGDRVFHGL
jgi:DNA polymerase-4